MAGLVVILILIGTGIIITIWDRWIDSHPEPRRYQEIVNPIGTFVEYFSDINYRHSKQMSEDIVRGAALVEQRENSRHLGPPAHYYLNVGSSNMDSDYETAKHARWIEEHGSSNDVYIHVMDGDRELGGRERYEVLHRDDDVADQWNIWHSQ